MESKIDNVKLSRLKKIIEKVEEHYPNEDVELSFEFIVGSLFPTVFQNVNKEMGRQHMLGYKEGYEDALKEKKND